MPASLTMLSAALHSCQSGILSLECRLMRVVIQRVTEASVSIHGETIGEIRRGFMILLGIEELDTTADVDWLARKIVRTRIFADDTGQMNLSLEDISGDALVVSQFTLHASTKKGNRPSFTRASRPDHAIPLYENLLGQLGEHLGKPCQSGRFGADMQVSLTNDGPVTILIDSQNRE